MPYRIGGDAAPRARQPERLTYTEERVVRRVSGPDGYVRRYAGNAENDDWDRPVRVKMVEEPKKEPGFIEKVGRNGGTLLATAAGVGGMGAFFYGGFLAIGGSHAVPGLGHIPTAGVAPGALMVGGFLAMAAGGALYHWIKPKK